MTARRWVGPAHREDEHLDFCVEELVSRLLLA